MPAGFPFQEGLPIQLSGAWQGAASRGQLLHGLPQLQNPDLTGGHVLPGAAHIPVNEAWPSAVNAGSLAEGTHATAPHLMGRGFDAPASQFYFSLCQMPPPPSSFYRC